MIYECSCIETKPFRSGAYGVMNFTRSPAFSATNTICIWKLQIEEVMKEKTRNRSRSAKEKGRRRKDGGET